MPVLSIIVPVYNSEKYLSRCINSILRQTFMDFELILVDDGSTDHSGKIIDDYVSQDNRIIGLHQRNEGVGGARNNGISHAKGELVGFIDSDDYIEDTMYQKLVDVIYRENVDISASGICLKGFDSIDEQSVCYSKNGINIISTNELMEDIVNCENPQKAILLQSLVNKVFRIRVLKDIVFTGTFCEDCDAISSICSNSYSIGFINTALYYYVNNSSSLIHTSNDEKRVRILDVFRHRVDLFSDSMIVDKSKEQYCTSYLYYYVNLYKKGTDIRSKYEAFFLRYVHELFRKGRCGTKLLVKSIIYRISSKMYYMIFK